ncbi:MAG TPA: CoA transferase [Clostridia bacterium]|nr:CoA transferase [Clostridia bacterium]
MYALLEGLRVLDLTRLLPGGYATQLLGDLGAEVLKVEDPWQGDYMRWMPPRLPGTKESSLFWGLNRNKKSMTLNLKSKGGKEIFLNLVRRYDVVVEGFRPGVMEELGLGYEALKEVNPGLIMCSISGYGQDGPYRERAGHDLNFVALAGVLGLTGEAPDRAPVVPPVQFGDLGGGALMAVVGILAACLARQRTGRGQYIDVSMLDGMISLMTMVFMEAGAAGPGHLQRGNMLLTGALANYNIYQTKDGKYLALAAFEDKFWQRFCRIIEREDLARRDHLQDPAVQEEIMQVFRGKTRDEWMALLGGEDICCEPVLEPAEVKEHPQVIARRMFMELTHSGAGPVEVVAPPLKFPGAPPREVLPPPGYGEHTVEVLTGELGLTPEEIQKLKEEGVL